MKELTNGKIIARLIQIERNICTVLKAWDGEINECISDEVMDHLYAKRNLLYAILMDDCGMDRKTIDAIVEGVDTLYGYGPEDEQ